MAAIRVPDSSQDQTSRVLCTLRANTPLLTEHRDVELPERRIGERASRIVRFVERDILSYMVGMKGFSSALFGRIIKADKHHLQSLSGVSIRRILHQYSIKWGAPLHRYCDLLYTAEASQKAKLKILATPVYAEPGVPPLASSR